MTHLIAVPVVLPLLAAAVILLSGGQRQWSARISVVSSAAGLAVAALLLNSVQGEAGAASIGVYLPSNWDVPFGIVLVVDRLSALMLVLTGIVSLASALYATARWDRAGVQYHALLQIQLMGVNGAFLTADLFNLFVFFEVMLAASYGLLLHGSGARRVRSGLHYIAVNLLASSLFLVGVAVLYGITGTLNMADMAQKIPQVPAADRALLHAGAAILGIAFLTKAAMWPLNFWLVRAYSAAAAPVAALFVLLTKVGIYAVLRLWTLLLSAQTGPSALFGGDALFLGGLATLALGAIGMLTAQQGRRLAGFAVIVSSGTLLAAFGFGSAALMAAALFYLVVSTLAVSALFLLADLMERSREPDTAHAPLHDDEPGDAPRYVAAPHRMGRGTPGEEDVPVGKAMPAPMAVLGLGFAAAALLIAGMPPLPGFLAKFAMMTAILDVRTDGGIVPGVSVGSWMLVAFLIVSGLFATIALSRAGIRYFWAPPDRAVPRLMPIEVAPIAALLLLCAILVVRADPVLRYAQAAAQGLLAPTGYIEAVMSAKPVPRPVP